MDVFLAAIPLQDRAVRIIGGGHAAEAKARLFLTSPARLIWHAPAGQTIARDIAAKADIVHRPPTLAELKGAALVFVADAQDAGVIARARRAGALVNVVDRPADSDFQTPAIIDRGAVVAGVSTGGAAPVLAVDLRAEIERALPVHVGLLATAARSLRETVGRVLPDFDARRRFWRRTLRGAARDRALSGDATGARRMMLQDLDSARDAPTPAGVVYLVGAGPGDPELLTLKALHLLRDADVIVHDRLVSDGVLAMARRDARRIDVGKTRGRHPVPQDEIERILIGEARKGLRVVRLKGGDPLIFARGGEEIAALSAAGIDAHVVPGVTAAQACAAAAGMALTHRDNAQAVTLVSGQPRPGGDGADYAALAARNHTLAFYMGVGAAQTIHDRLVAAGRSATTPVAIVENGYLPGERVLTGRLGDLPRLVREGGVTAPSIIFVGEAAAAAIEKSAPHAAEAAA